MKTNSIPLLFKLIGALLGATTAIASYSAAATDTVADGGEGGHAFRFVCPPGQVLVGVHGNTGQWIDRLGAVCASWNPTTRELGQIQKRNELFGGNGGHYVTFVCPGPNAIVGWRINPTYMDSPRIVAFVAPRCQGLAPPHAMIDLRGVGGRVIGNDTMVQRWPGTRFYREPVEVFCRQGEIAIGLHGRHGVYLDSIGLVCGPLPVAAVPPGPPPPVRNFFRRVVTFATAKNDVDIYNGPDGRFTVVGMMRANETAESIRLQGGWRQLRFARIPGGTGWVAEDHLTNVSRR